MHKHIIIFFSILIAYSCFAENIDTGPIVINKFNVSIINVKNSFEECSSKGERVLDSDIFNKVKASQDQKKIALKYYYFKTVTECSSDAVKDYLLASAMRTFGDKSTPRILRDADELIVSNHLLFLKAEAEYHNTVSVENKKDFEAIEELKLPFELIKSAKALGLYESQ